MPRGRDKQYSPSSVAGSERHSISAIDYLNADPAKVADELATFGLQADWIGKQPDDEAVADDARIYRFQHMRRYEYVQGGGKNGSDIGDIQIKTLIFTVGRPPDNLTSRIADDTDKVTTAFDTGTYDTYLSGFFPELAETDYEIEEVGHDDANNLGIPQFAVEVYTPEQQLSGVATGFLDPFEVEERTETTGAPPTPANPAPKRERWDIQKQAARGTYEFVTEGPARERARNAAGKRVVINGIDTGKTLRAARGSFEIKKEYANPERQNAKDRATILDESGASYQSWQDGGSLWKVGETADAIQFELTKPSRGFEPVEPDEVDPQNTGPADPPEQPGIGDWGRTKTVYELELSDTTIVEVRRDERKVRHLGLYSPVVKREIEREMVL
jgi:hypothetical protein